MKCVNVLDSFTDVTNNDARCGTLAFNVIFCSYLVRFDQQMSLSFSDAM